MTTPRGLLLLLTWLPSEAHDEFSAWCDDHHRELLTVPGFLRARRFARIDGDGTDAQFLTMYETTDSSVLSSDAYIEHGRNSTGLPEFLKGKLRMSRLDCELESATPEDWWPGSLGHELLMVTHTDGEPFSSSGSTGDIAFPDTVRTYRSSQGPRVLLSEPAGTPEVENATDPSQQWSRWRCAFAESAPESAS